MFLSSTWRLRRTASWWFLMIRFCIRRSAPDPKPEAAIHSLTLATNFAIGIAERSKIRRSRSSRPFPERACRRLTQVFDLAPQGTFRKFNIETKIFADHPELSPPPDEFVRLVLAMIRKHHLESAHHFAVLRFPDTSRK